MQTSTANDLMTGQQAAKILHICESSVRKYIRDGDLPVFRIAGIRELRIRRADALALLQPIPPQKDA